MAVAFLPMFPELRRYCIFSTALDQSEMTVLMKRPQESATGSGLLAPFDKTVWLLVFTAVLFVGPVIYVFAKLRFVNSYEEQAKKHILTQLSLTLSILSSRAQLWKNPDSENYGLFACVWFVYSSLLKQGTNIIATTGTRNYKIFITTSFICV